MSDILIRTFIEFIKVLPILVIAIVVSQIVRIHLNKDTLKKHVDASGKSIAKASAFGVMTPGPLLAFLPLLKTLKKKGLPIGVLTAFITGQTLIGPGRLFLEVDYFGITFFAARVVISLLIAIGVGLSFRLLEKFTKF